MSELAQRIDEESVVAEQVIVHGVEEFGRTQWQITWRRFRRHKLAMASLVVLVVFYVSAALAPIFAPFEPNTLDLTSLRQPPSLDHLMGTDVLGRDLFSRIVFGGRVSLSVGIGVAISAGLIGTTVGALAGFRGGWIDNLLMRTTDFFLVLPTLAVLMMASRALGGSIFDIVLVLSAFFWMPLARVIRGVFLSIKEKEFVEAARASGAGGARIVLRHMLPNALGPIVVFVTLAIAEAILVESALSFLGFGIQPPQASWGNMIAQAKDAMVTQPWLMWFPGLMILVTVLCVNFLGDGLRDALDPTGTRMRA